MTFEVLTHLTPEEVLDRASRYYRERTRLEEAERSNHAIAFQGRSGRARVEARRHYAHTLVRAETDRGVGLDVTDLTLRFLYTIPTV